MYRILTAYTASGEVVCGSRLLRGSVLVARAVIKKQLQNVRAIEGVYLRLAPLKGKCSRGSRRYQEAAHCMPLPMNAVQLRPQTTQSAVEIKTALLA